MTRPLLVGSGQALRFGGLLLALLAVPGCDLEPERDDLRFHGRDPTAWPAAFARRIDPLRPLIAEVDRVQSGWAQLEPPREDRRPAPGSVGFGPHRLTAPWIETSPECRSALVRLLLDPGSYEPFAGSLGALAADRSGLLWLRTGERALAVVVDLEGGVLELETGLAARPESFRLTAAARVELARLAGWR